MNDFRETRLNLFVRWRSDRMFATISLNGAGVPYATGFSGLLFFAHSAKFTRMPGFIHLDRLLKCLTCERWSYTIVYDHGNQMGGPSAQALGITVNPGETKDISITLVAPTAPDNYTGYWKLRNTSGITFTQFYAAIKVQGGSSFAVTSVNYVLAAWNDAGHVNCPRVIAQITTNGPGTVTYKWTRMDDPGGGATQSITFAAAGTKNVRYDWTRGSAWAGTPTWVGMIIVSPNNQNFGHINFTTACTVP